MKTDGLKNPSVCFHVIPDDGGSLKHVGSLINGIFFLIAYLLVLLIMCVWGFFCPVGLLNEEH